MNNIATLSGYMILSASCKPHIPDIFYEGDLFTGSHSSGPYNGSYLISTAGSYLSSELLLPTRNKQLKTFILSESQDLILESLSKDFSDIESRYKQGRYLYRLNEFMKLLDTKIKHSYVIVLSNQLTHGHLIFLVKGYCLYLWGMYDTINKSVSLVWSLDEHLDIDIKKKTHPRYIFYRYPVIKNRPLFIYSEMLCSNWRYWSRVFTKKDSLLKSFNALENFLFKDPEVKSFKENYGCSFQFKET